MSNIAIIVVEQNMCKLSVGNYILAVSVILPIMIIKNVETKKYQLLTYKYIVVG
jgi:hypothetical protein